MPLGGADNPFGGLELQAQSASATPEATPPLAVVVAAGDAAQSSRQQSEAAHAAAEEPEKTKAEILLAVQTDWNYCGLEPCDESAELATDILAEYQAERQASNPAYVLGETENQERLNWLVEQGSERRTRQASETQTIALEAAETTHTEDSAEDHEGSAEDHEDSTEDREDSANRRAEWMAQFNGDFVAAVQAAGNTTEVNRIRPLDLGEPPDPKLLAEQAKLMQFQQILAVADAVPADAQIIRQRMRSVDFSTGVPDPIQFIQTAILSSADYDSGVSQATQDAITAEFGITPTRPDQPRNASEMQTTLREGQGTREITEIQRVEEPPGSGIFVEKEVVVGEEPIPFTENDRLVLSKDPLITVFPDPPGGTMHRVEGKVSGGIPVRIFVDIPPEGAFPAAAVNNRMNEQIQNTVFRNHGMTGVLEYFHGRGDSTTGAATETDFDSIGRNDMSQAIMQTFIGENTTLGGRFITGSEIHNMEGGLRHLTPGGDFGAFNQLDPKIANGLMTAMFGTGQANIIANLNRARPFVNTGGAEAPSFEALYAKMYPADAADGYTQLRQLAGKRAVAVLNLPSIAKA